jgi:hypothetical protein
MRADSVGTRTRPPRAPDSLRLALERLLAIGSLVPRSWRSANSSRAAVSVIVVAAGCGLLAGVTARLMDVYGSAGIALVGAGAAAWVTLAFWTARRSERALIAVVAAATYLLFWLSAFYTTDAIQQGVPISLMWPIARSWVFLLAPASVFIGAAAWRSRRGGIAGDAALALPVSWSLAEAFRGATGRATPTAWLLAGLLLLGLAAALVATVCRRRRVNPRTFTVAVLVEVVAFVFVAAVWFWLQRP